MNSKPPMPSQWVIGKYKGQRAQYIKGLADAGIGYFIREESGKGGSLEITAAFRRPMDSPLPDHLLLANHFQVEKLNNLLLVRNGQDRLNKKRPAIAKERLA